MTELDEIFLELGLSQYLEVFIEHGFDTWDTILDITESDFNALGVKLGHRRKLQRKIANTRGLSSDQALLSPTPRPSVEDKQLDEPKATESKTDFKDENNAGSGKRKYKRHPKIDENAPERPPSAYVIFSNKMRVDLKGRHLSFTEIAKLVGENWQSLPPGEKEPYESQAFRLKEKYNAELAEYRKTQNYQNYLDYLSEFKTKQAGVQYVATDVSKRPKLEHRVSSGSSGPGSSADSQQGAEKVSEILKGESKGSAPDAKSLSARRPSLPPRSGNTSGSKTNESDGEGVANKGQGSPSKHHSGILPGYRDSMYAAGQRQTLAWRDSRRSSNASSPQFPSVPNMSGRRSGQSETPPMDPVSRSEMRLPGDRSIGPAFSPPPLSTESTAGTAGSSSSSSHYMPRTPLEPTLPTIQPSISYQNQLPPLRSISLSPQSSNEVSYNSPSSIFVPDFPSAHPRRGYPQTYHQHPGFAAAIDQAAPARPMKTSEEEILDPVSALLRADEIVNRTNRDPHSP